MKKWTSLFASALLLFSVSCNEMDKYYDNDAHSTSVSVGNAWDYLASRGNFTNFLAGVEKAGYKSLVSGTGLATIFAPDDEAFQKYFARHGYSSLAEIPDDELSNVITYHLLYYSFNPDRFMLYKPKGVDTEDDWVGLYYKHRTKSRDAMEMVYDPSAGIERPVFHYEKFVPVFSPYLFNYYVGSTGTYNYGYFYGDGLWQGDAWAAGSEPYFRVSNAGVKEYGIITDNGYIYITDDVVEPLPTIYQAMAAEENFSIFTAAYDRFKDLTYDEDISQNYNNSDSTFVYNHTGMPSIALEWPITTSVSMLGPLSYGSLTVFAPSNAAMEEFYNRYWAPYYGTNNWDSIKFTPLIAFMGEQVATHRLNGMVGPLLPSEISQQNAVTGVSSSVITIDPNSQIITKEFCSNGILYGVDQLVAVPKYFSYVTAPAFVDPDYNMFLLLMMRSGDLDLYTSETQTFYAFYPNDDMLKNTTINAENLIYENPQPNKYGFEDITVSDGEGTVSLSMANSSMIVRNQICDKCIEVVGSDEKIYRTTYDTYNYVYQKGDSIFSTAKFNSHYGLQGKNDYYDMITITEITGDLPEVRNGHVFALNGERLASALLPEDRTFQSIAVNEVQLPWEFLETSAGSRNFYQTGLKASVNDSTGTLDVYEVIKAVEGGSIPRHIIFALSNEAVEKAWTDKIITTNGRLNYFKYYMPNLFFSVERSRLIDYPFANDGYGTRTLQSYKANADGVYSTVTVQDMGTHLQLTDSKGNTAKVINTFPYIYSDCAIYLIDNYLDFGDEYNVTQY